MKVVRVGREEEKGAGGHKDVQADDLSVLDLGERTHGRLAGHEDHHAEGLALARGTADAGHEGVADRVLWAAAAVESRDEELNDVGEPQTRCEKSTLTRTKRNTQHADRHKKNDEPGFRCR
jgi:hypothetical protein